MIIYTHDTNGRAVNFKFSKKCPTGWESIDSDKIPYDTSQYHTGEYKDRLVQKEINRNARKFLSENDWKIIRHQRQIKSIETGKITTTSLTEQEYGDLCDEMQRQADLVIG